MVKQVCLVNLISSKQFDLQITRPYSPNIIIIILEGFAPFLVCILDEN